jgi:hypothetical protein
LTDLPEKIPVQEQVNDNQFGECKTHNIDPTGGI